MTLKHLIPARAVLRLGWLLLLAGWMFLACVENGFSAVAAPRPAFYRVAGRVCDADTGRPLAHFNMEFGGRSRVWFLTDAKGAFHVQVPAGGAWELRALPAPNGEYVIDAARLHAMNPGLTDDAVWKTLALDADVAWLDVRIPFKHFPAIGGRVLDVHGKPAAGAMVYVRDDLPAVAADDAGNFKILTPPQAAPCALLATWLGEDGSLTLGTARGAAGTSVTIQLMRTTTTVCRVIDEEGLPVPQFEFTLTPLLNGMPLRTAALFSVTDAAGSFKVPWVCAGLPYHLSWLTQFNYANYYRAEYEAGDLSVAADDVGPKTPIRLTAPRFIHHVSGVVVDPQGKPIPDASVESISGTLPKHYASEDRLTGLRGEFLIGKLGKGTVTLRAGFFGYQATTVTLDTRTQNARIVLEPYRARTFVHSFNITDAAGAPVAGAKVSFYLLDRTARPIAWHLHHCAVSDARGSCTVSWASPEKIPPYFFAPAVSVDKAGYNLCYRFLPFEERCVQFTLEREEAPYRATVVDAAGAPVAGAAVELKSYVRPGVGRLLGSAPVLPMQHFTTNAKGEFAIPRLNAHGHFFFDLSAARFGSQTFDSTTMTRPVFTLQPSGGIRGKLSGLNAALVPYKVSMLVSSSASLWRTRVSVADDGTFKIGGLAPGEYILEPRTDGDAFVFSSELNWYFSSWSAPRVIVRAGVITEKDITVLACRPITGVLAGAHGTALTTANAFIDFVSAGRDAGSSKGEARVHADGRWVSMVPAGDYTIKVDMLSKNAWPGFSARVLNPALHVDAGTTTLSLRVEVVLEKRVD